MKYKLDDKPNRLDMFIYALQWFFVSISSVVILSGVVTNLYGQSAEMMTIYMQKCFFLTGIALVLQVYFGHKLPIIVGPASVLIIGLLSTLNLSPAASFTAIAIGGLLTFLLSFGKVFSIIQKFFTARVVVVTLLLVAISMMPLIIDLSAGKNGKTYFNMAFSIGLTLVMIISNNLLKGIGKSLVIVLGMVLGSLAYIAVQGVPEISTADYSWNLFFENLVIKPEFNISAILAFLFCYLALLVNEFGSIQATASYLKADNLIERGQKGIRVSGLLNGLSGMMGVVGMINYSLSAGVIAATRAASRYPLAWTGVLLMLCALIPQSLFVFSYIPMVVMGSIMLYIMCAQMGAGMQLMVSEKAIFNFNSMITVSFPVMLSIVISFAPQEFKESVPSLLQPILANGFVMGIIAVLILENTLNRKTEKQ